LNPSILKLDLADKHRRTIIDKMTGNVQITMEIFILMARNDESNLYVQRDRHIFSKIACLGHFLKRHWKHDTKLHKSNIAT
jgi:hypothetical protein